MFHVLSRNSLFLEDLARSTPIILRLAAFSLRACCPQLITNKCLAQSNRQVRPTQSKYQAIIQCTRKPQ